ncbi:hypothetical protein N7481_013376 [Penicillium waksmanii]|uniref:uncharacterized protein n=1 Tax=Penicillium waksmanii TaxID=69791 RepID=UPI0025465E13|nr:uncharacterized protein N7481_013376 [Penicillium waksmanii]KAJ5963071.1 hypothetical protein N7481_013376 [Penicillium waksmanii]
MDIILEDPSAVDSSSDAFLLRTGIQAEYSAPRGRPMQCACASWPEDYVSRWLAGFTQPANAAQAIPTEQDIPTSLMLMYHEFTNPATTGSC